ncbi:MAG: acetyl-CoA carboxylase biotin carboxyl carrier protein subunit, partial [Oscillibacter sp.]|nr:acetyl-CoA carboxylase biotin carboxyl carrier protein subunit [Oscillibacter sp.]
PAAGAEALVAPFPGKILAVSVAPGTVVQAGQQLMILEAMKMENEILSPRAGTIVSVDVAVGQNVDTNAQLCVIQSGPALSAILLRKEQCHG